MSLNITGQTKVVGIIGCPVEHSFSPAMHNAAFAHLGLDYVYVPLPVHPQEVDRAIEGVRSLGLAGINVTIPHKTAVLRYLDRLAPEARLIGAVNTIVQDAGILTGYNTDALGFVRSLEIDAGVNPAGKIIFIAGAGGAARAVSIQLALAGAGEIIFSTPYPEEIGPLKKTITDNTAASVQEAPWGKTASYMAISDIVINATPMGMHPHIDKIPPLDVAALPDHAIVCDLIYNPGQTMLLQQAAGRGLATLNGMGMLLYQGAIAFQKWTGVEPPVEVMREALAAALAGS